MEIAFWTLVGIVGWTYLGYPCLLLLLCLVRSRSLERRRVQRRPFYPSVTVIIAVYNEERHLRRKIENTLTSYPREKLEIIVASDASTDRTHEIVRDFRERGVKLVVLPERQGKTAAQNAAASEAGGEILVFTDATAEFGPDTIAEVLRAFVDPRVGCVGAELEYVSEAETAVGKGCRTYWQYERRVKELEAEVNSLIGVSGCLYAVRADLYRPIEPDLISDFVVAMDTFAGGHLTAYARATVSRERTHERTHELPQPEFEMRVRVTVRSIHALVRRYRMLNPFRYGFFAVQLLSHKVMRYLVPQCLIAVFLLNLALALETGPTGSWYGWLLLAQSTMYAAAAVQAVALRLDRRLRILYIPFYFVHSNAAALKAFLLYLSGRRDVTWTPARESERTRRGDAMALAGHGFARSFDVAGPPCPAA